MKFAGHLPTMLFGHAEWLAMNVWQEGSEDLAENGLYRSTMRGKPIVIRCNWEDKINFMVRPIVRVKMGRAVV
jgi:hypothetical protein